MQHVQFCCIWTGSFLVQIITNASKITSTQNSSNSNLGKRICKVILWSGYVIQVLYAHIIIMPIQKMERKWPLLLQVMGYKSCSNHHRVFGMWLYWVRCPWKNITYQRKCIFYQNKSIYIYRVDWHIGAADIPSRYQP